MRENTEGEYSSIGGRMFEGTDREVVLQETVMTRVGVDRVLRYAFELAAVPAAAQADLGDQEQRHLDHDAVLGRARRGDGGAVPRRATSTSSTSTSSPRTSCCKPDWFDVVVASNLFGDILTDLGPACTGTIGIAPSANINPDARAARACSSPSTAPPRTSPGRGIANPIGQIWCGAMMLEHLGHADAGAATLRAIERVLEDGTVLTGDLGGSATTAELGAEIAAAIS